MKKMNKIVFWVLAVAALVYMIVTVRRCYETFVDVLSAVTSTLEKIR